MRFFEMMNEEVLDLYKKVLFMILERREIIFKFVFSNLEYVIRFYLFILFSYSY